MIEQVLNGRETSEVFREYHRHWHDFLSRRIPTFRDRNELKQGFLSFFVDEKIDGGWEGAFFLIRRDMYCDLHNRGELDLYFQLKNSSEFKVEMYKHFLTLTYRHWSDYVDLIAEYDGSEDVEYFKEYGGTTTVGISESNEYSDIGCQVDSSESTLIEYSDTGYEVDSPENFSGNSLTEYSDTGVSIFPKLGEDKEGGGVARGGIHICPNTPPAAKLEWDLFIDEIPPYRDYILDQKTPVSELDWQRIRLSKVPFKVDLEDRLRMVVSSGDKLTLPSQSYLRSHDIDRLEKLIGNASALDWLEPERLMYLYRTLGVITSKCDDYEEREGTGSGFLRGGFVSIGSREIDNLSSRNWKFGQACIAVLACIGVVEINPRYCKGRFPMSYRLGGEFRKSPKRKHVFERTRQRNFRGSSVSKTDPSDEGMFSKIESSYRKLTVDFDAVTEVRTSLSEERLCRFDESLRGFHQDRRYVKRGSNVRRVYYPFTNLSRELRECLRYEGQCLVEVDVQSCIFVLLMKLIDWGEVPDAEKCDYVEMLGTDIYTALGQEWTRQAAKKSAIIMVSRRYKISSPNGFELAFKRRFPNIYRQISESETTSRDYQNLEASIMIDGVVRRFLAESPDGVCLPLHDGIYTLDCLADLVAHLMKEEICGTTGFDANVTIS